MSEGLKYDNDKVRYDLVLPEFTEGVAKVLTMGAKKYKPNSWQHVENGRERYYAALLRHLQAWRKGEIFDKESGLSHLHHVATNVMFLEYFDGKGGVLEDKIKEFIEALSKDYSTS